MTTIEQLRAALSQHIDEQLANGDTIFINTRAYREDNRVPTVAYRDITVDKYPNQPSDHADHRHPNDSLLP